MSADETPPESCEEIWRAGVAAVDSERLVHDVVHCDGATLRICDARFEVARLRRVVVVGAGKAGAGMAAAFERAVGPDLRPNLSGWVNVPADCVRELERMHLHAARPAGHNEPTEEGVRGAEEILRLVSSLGRNDLCVVLISGGGSALLPAPVEKITLADLQQVTKLLMQSGATINELNCVRKQLSRVKGGRLARAAAKAKQVLTLIVSDVVGDPLDVIASGPTVPDTTTAADALSVLRKYGGEGDTVPPAVQRYLERRAAEERGRKPAPFPTNVSNHVIGNNAVALGAAADRARELGFQVHSLGSENVGEARDEGAALADLCRSIRDGGKPLASPACVLSGGEPVVHLAETDQPRKGGRNQELVLAAIERLWDDGAERIALLSGGTDGEDGPTDAAGGVLDANVLRRAHESGLDPTAHLAINDSYPFLAACGGLLITGPTHTNVMDLRVALVK